jgi:hypothetical protein
VIAAVMVGKYIEQLLKTQTNSYQLVNKKLKLVKKASYLKHQLEEFYKGNQDIKVHGK